MKLLVCTLLCLTSCFGFGQQDTLNRYKFSVSISAMSTLNYGFKSFNDLNLSPYGESQLAVFKDEKYTVDYQNFNFSKDFDLQLSVNWLNSDKYILRQSFSVFIGKATERARLTLTTFGEKTGVENVYPEYQYWADNLTVGYQSTYSIESNYYGIYNQFMLLKKFKNALNLGIGLSSVRRFRQEFYPIFDAGYLSDRPWDPLDSYYTRQLCISTQVEKSKDRFTGFLNFSQSVLILKKNKGHAQVPKGEIEAVSNNLDYWFLLYIKAGLSFNFKSMNNKQ